MGAALGGLGVHPTAFFPQDREGTTPMCEMCQFAVKAAESLLENNVTEVSPAVAVQGWGH